MWSFLNVVYHMPRMGIRKRAGAFGHLRMGMAAAAVVLLSAGLGAPAAAAQSPVEATARPSRAHRTAEPVARLQAAIDSGAVTLAHDSLFGYLPGLLDALGIPVSSQTLVFSRTSLQTDRIAPWAPRALYFNDDVYVGYVQESSFLEIASVHPTEGGKFFTLDQSETEKPRFQEETTTCLMCHESRSVTGGVPGFIVRSVLADRLGYVISDVHRGSTTDRTPLEDRWGGWYVTGTHGEALHSGNVRSEALEHEIPNSRDYVRAFDMASGGNVTELEDRFDPTPYLTGDSDIVALMVLTHQAQLHNTIAWAHTATREALRDQAAGLLSAGQTLDPDSLTPTARARIDGAADRLVREMFLSREAELSSPLQGTTAFAEEFAALGPHDAQGRSLRDVELVTRLFRYPLSFLVYSDAFQALPDILKDRVYAGFGRVLSGRDDREEFAHLSPEDRTAILEILIQTLPEFERRSEEMAPSGPVGRLR